MAKTEPIRRTRKKVELSIESQAQRRIEAFCTKWLDEPGATDFVNELQQKNLEPAAALTLIEEIETSLDQEVEQDTLVRLHSDIAKERAALTKAKFKDRTIGLFKQHAYELSKVFGSIGDKGYTADLNRKRQELSDNAEYRKHTAKNIIERKTKLLILQGYCEKAPNLKKALDQFVQGEISWTQLRTTEDFKLAIPEIVKLWAGERRVVDLGDQAISSTDSAMAGQLRALAANELMELAQLAKWDSESAGTHAQPTNWKDKTKHVLTSSVLMSSSASVALRWGGRAALGAGMATGGWAILGGMAVGAAAGAGAGFIRERLKRQQRTEEQHWQMVAGEELENTAYVTAESLIKNLRAQMVVLVNPQLDHNQIKAALELKGEIVERLASDVISYGTQEGRTKVQHELTQVLKEFDRIMRRVVNNGKVNQLTIDDITAQSAKHHHEKIANEKAASQKRTEQKERALQVRGAAYGSLIGGVMGGVAPLAMDTLSHWLGNNNVVLSNNLSAAEPVRFVAPTSDGVAQVADVKVLDQTHLTVSTPTQTLGKIDAGAIGPLPPGGVHAEVIPTNNAATILRLQDTLTNRTLGDVAIQLKTEGLLEQIGQNSSMQEVLKRLGIPQEAIVLEHGSLGIDESKLPAGSDLINNGGAWRAGRMENILRAWQLGEKPTNGAELYVGRAELAEWYKQNEHLSLDKAIEKAWSKPVEMVQKFQQSYEGPIKSDWNAAVEALGKTQVELGTAPAETATPAGATSTAVETAATPTAQPDKTPMTPPTPADTATSNELWGKAAAVAALGTAAAVGAVKLKRRHERLNRGTQETHDNGEEMATVEAPTTIVQPPVTSQNRNTNRPPIRPQRRPIPPLSPPQPATIPPAPFRDNVLVRRPAPARLDTGLPMRLTSSAEKMRPADISTYFPELSGYDEATESLRLQTSPESRLSLAIPEYGTCSFNETDSDIDLSDPSKPNAILTFDYTDSHFLAIRRENLGNNDAMITLVHNFNQGGYSEETQPVLIHSAHELADLIKDVLPTAAEVTPPDLTSLPEESTESLTEVVTTLIPPGPNTVEPEAITSELEQATTPLVAHPRPVGHPLPTPEQTFAAGSPSATPERAEHTALKEMIEEATKQTEALLRHFEQSYIVRDFPPTLDGISISQAITELVRQSDQLTKAVAELWENIPADQQTITLATRKPFDNKKEKTTAEKRLKFFKSEIDKRIDRAHGTMRDWFLRSVQFLDTQFTQLTEAMARGDGSSSGTMAELYTAIYRLQDAAKLLVNPKAAAEHTAFRRELKTAHATLSRIYGLLQNNRPDTPFSHAGQKTRPAPETSAERALETERQPRIMKLKQFKYGKLLESERGAIVNGIDHQNTGWSPNFPDEAMQYEFIQNNFFGKKDGEFGIDYYNRHALKTYAWKQEGGPIVKKNLTVDGRRYVFIAQQAQRSEAGENKSDRNYTERHVIAIPEDEWSIALIPQLPNIMDTHGLVKKRAYGKMKEIEVSDAILDQSLPADWFDTDVQELITQIATGKTVGVQDWSEQRISEKDFLQKLFHCLICFPEQVSQKVSLGVGLMDSREANAQINLTQKAYNEVRKVARTWRGVSAEDGAAGETYLAQVKDKIKNCRTPRDVMQAITQMDAVTTQSVLRRFKL